jgi:hypothetical protein
MGTSKRMPFGVDFKENILDIIGLHKTQFQKEGIYISK